MIYAYIRVSTDKQTLETQRLEIEKFALNKKFFVDAWVSEIVSGTKAAADRKLGSLLKKMKKGDILIISEISRLGRIPGKKNSKYKLTGKEDVIKRMLIKGEPKKTICRKLRCSFNTLKKHIARNPALSQYVKDK